MKKDYAIEDIRKIRKQISKKFNNNPKLLINHYKLLEKKFAIRMNSGK